MVAQTTQNTQAPLLLDSPKSFSLIPYRDDCWDRAQLRRCFKDDESNVQVDWTEIDAEHRATPRTFKSLAELQSVWGQLKTPENGLRVISINQGNSWRPLNVTRGLFEAIASTAGTSDSLLNLALSFHDKFMATEEAFSSAPVFNCNDCSIEIAYTFKYAFKKIDNDKPESWSTRQTGVYQKYDIKKKHSTWIFMNPNKECLFQKRLTQLLLSQIYCSQLKEHPLLIHNILFATFLPNWRDYLAAYEARVLPVSNTTMVERIQDTLRINHQMLTSIRAVELRCLPLQAIFRSFGKTLSVLQQGNNALRDCSIVHPASWQSMKQLLDNYDHSVDAYSQGASFLQSRAATTAQLISDTFAFKSSDTAQRQTIYMLDLTRKTVDDSTTVRVITIVTLIYLPSTFMATLLGMNSFFEMDPDTRKLIVSPQFWIFVVCSVPLTAVTVLYWWLRRKRDMKQGEAKAQQDV
ncbi:hypothetical protein BBP40_010920 [Aspergillus hancockii]|nr:hypothetical protein BBP40_010920 [Aspergillus hancockii]